MVASMLPNLSVVLMLAILVNGVAASNGISFVGNISGFSFDDASHHLFFAQSRYWIFYPFATQWGQHISYSSSLDGRIWFDPSYVNLPIFCSKGPSSPLCGELVSFVATSDGTYVYLGFGGGDGIWFAFAGLNSNGSITLNADGGSLKQVSSQGGYRFSIGLNSGGHVFIASSGYGCSLCVFDSSTSPYTLWMNSLRVSQTSSDTPVILPYKTGQMMVIEGNYSNIWNGSWATAISVPRNSGPDNYAFFAHGIVLLFKRTESCQTTNGLECVSFLTFNGMKWSTEHVTNVVVSVDHYFRTQFAITYDGSNDRFLIFTHDPTATILYEYSGHVHSTSYQRTTIAAERSLIEPMTSIETTHVNSTTHVDNVAVARAESSRGNNPDASDCILAYVGPTQA